MGPSGHHGFRVHWGAAACCAQGRVGSLGTPETETMRETPHHPQGTCRLQGEVLLHPHGSWDRVPEAQFPGPKGRRGC